MTTTYVLIMGLPGSGKGTLAKNLVKRFECTHVSCGDVFRDEIQQQTAFGVSAMKYIQAGQLTPDNETSQMFLSHLTALSPGKYLLEGYPRTIAQVHEFLRHLDHTKRRLDAVLYLDAPRDELIRRVTSRRTCPTCGAVYNLRTRSPRHADICDMDGARLVRRPDDQHPVATSRIDLYEEKERDVVAYFQTNAALRRLAADASTEDVLEKAVTVLALVLERRTSVCNCPFD
jgi:adenylate kinase